MSEVKRLPKIIRQCMTIGMLPTSYKVSLTYEEQLMWFCNFLENEVIPVVNNNSAVVEELKNYFENLDVQEEIDNKLEEMAESGELADIIAQYLELAGILAYNTTSDLKNATNLSNGSFAKTYGSLVYSDGQGSFYKIRTLINTDVIDEDTLLALTNYPNLVAEKIPEKINLFQTKKPNNMNKVVFIGDSYSVLENQNTWVDYMVLRLGLTSSDYILKGEGSTGFQNYNVTTNHRFIDLLESAYNDSTNPNDVTHIIVGGGANDIQETYTVNSIFEYITAFISYARTHFPNAQVYIANIGFTIDINKKVYFKNVYEAYSRAKDVGAIYLKGVENAIHYYPYFLTNGHYDTSNVIHPNQAGSSAIGHALYEALLNGYSTTFRQWELLEDNRSLNSLYTMQNNDSYKLKLAQYYRIILSPSPSDVICRPTNEIEMVEFTGGCVGGCTNYNSEIPYSIILQDNENICHSVNGTLTISSKIVDNYIRQVLIFKPFELDLTSSGVEGYKKYSTIALYFPPFEIDLDYSEC